MVSSVFNFRRRVLIGVVFVFFLIYLIVMLVCSYGGLDEVGDVGILSNACQESNNIIVKGFSFDSPLNSFREKLRLNREYYWRGSNKRTCSKNMGNSYKRMYDRLKREGYDIIHEIGEEFFGTANPIPDVSVANEKYEHKFHHTEHTNMVMYDEKEELEFLDSLLVYEKEFEGKYIDSKMMNENGQKFLYMLVRHQKPKIYFEIGSGVSTHATWLACEENKKEGHPCRIICVEPYRADLMEELPGVEVFVERIEDIRIFDAVHLEENDIVFIDSSHALYPFNDVWEEFLFIVPKIPPGVLIQVHDMRFPKGFWQPIHNTPRRWWGEQFMLQALLYGNKRYKSVYTGYARPIDFKYRLGGFYFKWLR